MKRLLLICSLFLVLQVIKGQETVVTSTEATYSAMKKRIQKSDQDIQDPKKNILPKTWLNRGELFQSAYEINNLNYVRRGMAPNDFKLFYKEPEKIETVQLSNGVKQEKYTYYGFDVIVENGKVSDFYDTKTVDDKALEKAFEAFSKARQLDAEKKIDKKLKTPVENLREQFRNAAIAAFERAEQQRLSSALPDSGKANYKYAFNNFVSCLAVDTLPIVSVDTLKGAVSYYTGLAAHFSKDYVSAIKYFKLANDAHLKEPKVYYFLEQSELSLKDTSAAITALKEGTQKYPSENLLVIELVNLYIRLNEANAALEYLNKAKSLDPTNKTLYFAEGSLFDKIGKGDSAKAAYEGALKIDPEYFDATYNLGVYYYNNAVKLYADAAKEADIKKYNDLKALADEELKKSVPVMEKAHKISPQDQGTMQTLKTLYYRLRMDDKLKQIKQELGDK